MITTTLKRMLMACIPLAALISTVSAHTNVTTVVGGAVMTKGLLGILISLGIENHLTSVQAIYCYNLISLCILIFIAAMSGPRSEAAFCIIVPIFAGLLLYFGWLQLATKAMTQNLYFLIVMMVVFGIMLYMNDQNKQNYGTIGPGSKVFNLAIYLALFGACLTLVSGFTVGGLNPAAQSQPLPGTCQVGLPCDNFSNIDVTETTNTMKSASALDVGGAGTWMIENGFKFAIMAMNMLIGVFVFPLILGSTLNGIAPGISASPAYYVVAALHHLISKLYLCS